MVFLSFKADTRLQPKDSTQRTSLAPTKLEVLEQRDFMQRCAGRHGQRLSHYRFKPQTFIQPNTLLPRPLPRNDILPFMAEILYTAASRVSAKTGNPLAQARSTLQNRRWLELAQDRVQL